MNFYNIMTVEVPVFRCDFYLFILSLGLNLCILFVMLFIAGLRTETSLWIVKVADPRDSFQMNCKINRFEMI